LREEQPLPGLYVQLGHIRTSPLTPFLALPGPSSDSSPPPLNRLPSFLYSAGTVPRDRRGKDRFYITGKDTPDGGYVDAIPLTLTRELVESILQRIGVG
jgi:hypothetical protein